MELESLLAFPTIRTKRAAICIIRVCGMLTLAPAGMLVCAALLSSYHKSAPLSTKIVSTPSPCLACIGPPSGDTLWSSSDMEQ